jgi:hypothetical protein
MTRFELEVEEILVRGLPASQVSADLGPLVEERLTWLAQGERPRGQREGREALAELVADGIWAEVRRATAGLGRWA